MEAEMAQGFRWRGAGFCCPLENQLTYRAANRDSVTEVRFPLQNLRYLRLLEVPDGLTLDGQPIVIQSAYAEMEVYGRGFAPTATWESQIVDLGREVNFGRVVFEVSKWRKDGEQLVAREDGPVRVQVAFLPRRLRPAGDQRLRLGLETVLYDEAGEFGGEVFNRGEQSLLQRVEGGDVSEELGSNQLVVVASASSARLAARRCSILNGELVLVRSIWLRAPRTHSLLEGHAKGRRPSCPYVKSAVRLGDSASQRYAP